MPISGRVRVGLGVFWGLRVACLALRVVLGAACCVLRVLRVVRVGLVLVFLLCILCMSWYCRVLGVLRVERVACLRVACCACWGSACCVLRVVLDHSCTWVVLRHVGAAPPPSQLQPKIKRL